MISSWWDLAQVSSTCKWWCNYHNTLNERGHEPNDQLCNYASNHSDQCYERTWNKSVTLVISLSLNFILCGWKSSQSSHIQSKLPLLELIVFQYLIIPNLLYNPLNPDEVSWVKWFRGHWVHDKARSWPQKHDPKSNDAHADYEFIRIIIPKESYLWSE